MLLHQLLSSQQIERRVEARGVVTASGFNRLETGLLLLEVRHAFFFSFSFFLCFFCFLPFIFVYFDFVKPFFGFRPNGGRGGVSIFYRGRGFSWVY